jgi:hypothetical protein
VTGVGERQQCVRVISGQEGRTHLHVQRVPQLLDRWGDGDRKDRTPVGRDGASESSGLQMIANRGDVRADRVAKPVRAGGELERAITLRSRDTSGPGS